MNRRLLPIAILGLTAAMAARAAVPTKLLGDTIPPEQATRTIRIDQDTRYVNVNYGDTVRFQVNGQEFGFNFDGASDATSFDLRQVAPVGTVDHQVEVYIAPDQYDVGA